MTNPSRPPRFFMHLQAFHDDTRCVRIDPDGRAFGMTNDGCEWLYTAASLASCLEKVERGIWREVTADEAKPKTPTPADHVRHIRAHCQRACFVALACEPRAADACPNCQAADYLELLIAGSSLPVSAGLDRPTLKPEDYHIIAEAVDDFLSFDIVTDADPKEPT